MKQDYENLKELKQEIHNLYPKSWPNLVKEPVFRGRERTAIPGMSALTNLDTNETYSFVTKDYQVLLHEEAAHTLHQSVLKLKNRFPDYKITHQLLQNGAKYIGKVEFTTIAKDVKKGDPVSPFIIIKNSYDKTWARNLGFGATQLVCANGLVRPVTENNFRVKHIRGAGVAEMEEHIDKYLSETFFDSFDTWQLWTETKITLEEADKLWIKLPFSVSEVKKMQEMPLMGNNKNLKQLIEGDTATVWDINRAATQYLTHEVKSEMRKQVDTETVSRILTKKYH